MTTNNVLVDDAVQFSWLRYEGGYEWRRPKAYGAKYLSPGPKPTLIACDDDDWVLTTGRPFGNYGLARVVPEPDLFRTFGHVKPSREGIKEFADRFGLLGLPQGHGAAYLSVKHDRPPKSDGEAFLGSGELLSSWCDHIGAMSRAVDLWERSCDAESGNESALKSIIQWKEEDRVVYCSPYGGGETIAGSEIYPHILQRLQRGGLVRPAQFYLQRLIEEAQAAITARLLWRPPAKRSGVLAVERLGLYFVPSNLLSCLWLQLAQAVAGEYRFHRCKAPDCQKLILVSRHPRVGASKNKLTCSNTCRIRLYQERIRLASELRSGGKSIKEIASALGDDPADKDVQAKIQRWIRGAVK
jgi:hypothetical protein